jgi:hypothetical protein
MELMYGGPWNFIINNSREHRYGMLLKYSYLWLRKGEQNIFFAVYSGPNSRVTVM